MSLILRKKSPLLACAFALAFFGALSLAYADPNAPVEPPTLEWILGGDPNMVAVYEPLLSEFEYEPDTGKYKLKFEKEITNAFPDMPEGSIDLLIEEIEFDPDPTITLQVQVTNNSPAIQFITQGIAQPTSFGAPNLIAGAVTTQAIDGGFDGATVATLPGISLYQGQIDFATVATLQDDFFSLVAPPGGVNAAPTSFGPTPSNIPVNASIGIQVNFSLTPGSDAASVLSRFDVLIPEPTSFVLGSLGLMLLLPLIRRRRR